MKKKLYHRYILNILLDLNYKIQNSLSLLKFKFIFIRIIRIFRYTILFLKFEFYKVN